MATRTLRRRPDPRQFTLDHELPTYIGPLVAPLVDLTGQRFGKLRVIGRVGRRHLDATWHCLCDCGKRCIARGHSYAKAPVPNQPVCFRPRRGDGACGS